MDKVSWKQYKDSFNPIAAAMISKVAYREDEKVKVKLAHTKILTELDLTSDQTALIIAYFEAYLRLNPEEELIFNKSLKEEFGKEEVDKYMEIITSYHQDGFREGIKVGKIEGKIEGLKYVARNLLKMHNVSLKEITEVTGLSQEELEQLMVINKNNKDIIL